MLVIRLSFPARRFHATPWGRQVNEGVVEWPPSPWRLLRALIATWHHKFPQVSEDQMRGLVDALASPPRFVLPPASQAHSRHFMPLVKGQRTKVFDTFILVEPDDAVEMSWPGVQLSAEQRELLDQLLRSMSYFGRAESWVDAQLIDEPSGAHDVVPLELGAPAPDGYELVRTLIPVGPDQYAAWSTTARQKQTDQRMREVRAAAAAKGKGPDKAKLTKKDLQAIDGLLPSTLFDALHADTTDLRDAGWNVPPGGRWVNYQRRADAFAPRSVVSHATRHSTHIRPTLARFAVCGKVRPILTEALWFGERARHKLMGCSRYARPDENASPVFSGKNPDGSLLRDQHRHAHFLPEAAGDDHRITHLNVFAPRGFDLFDERAFQRFTKTELKDFDGYPVQFVLLGVGQAADFGGFNERAAESRALAAASDWVSRTPFVPTRFLDRRRQPRREEIAASPRLRQALCEQVRDELRVRPEFGPLADFVLIEPLLELHESGTALGGHWTTWLKFRRERMRGGGNRAGAQGFGFRLRFRDQAGNPVRVTGPIALGYGCHFGLGQFVAQP